MEFRSFTFIVTEDCNWECSYCYQKRGAQKLEPAFIEEASSFFSPFFAGDCQVHFYGGEPLLELRSIRRVVESLRPKNKGSQKRFRYSLTTNGSLLSDEVLAFLDRHRFEILLSFDGRAQDIGRKKGSFGQTAALLKKIRNFPNIRLITNSVFTPQTVNALSSSLRFIGEAGAEDILLSLSNNAVWNSRSILKLAEELGDLRRWLLGRYEKTGRIPIVDFREPEDGGVFGCSAGEDRLALAADGRVWGCYFFADYFSGPRAGPEGSPYCFGKFEDFARRAERLYPKILKNYGSLRQDSCVTPKGFCMLCQDLARCRICPVAAAFSSSALGLISSSTCRTTRTLNHQRQLFWKEARISPA